MTPLPLPLPLLLITHLMEVLMLLRALANQLPEVLEPAACTGSVLARRNRPGCRVGNEADEVAWTVAVHCPSVARHQLHANVAQEGNQVRHAPGAGPLGEC